MTEFLVNKFIKDSANIESTEVRTRYGMLASVVGIFCNVLLFSVKLAIGLILSSLAVTADAFNNLSDAASSIISFVGVKMAGKPADAEHPFGHGRIEYIAALIVSFLVIEVGFTFFKSSISKIMHPEEITFDPVPFIILILSILVKLWMAFFNNKLGKRIDSKVMLATAADSLGDVITTSATVISIVICHFTSINVDAIAGLIVSGIVIWSGVSIAKDTLEPLIGQRVPSELYQKITDIYATALDYDRTAKTTKQFFAKVQNKMHYAVHGHTAAELIYERADADKPHMGLTTWAAAPEGKIVKSDVSVAKNYLSEKEMRSLERIVSAYLDLAEDRAERHIPMTMEDWAKRLDLFLMADDRDVLQDAGKITAEIAKAKAETEFEKYRVIQDRLFMSDFDKYMLELEENAKK